MTTTVIKHSPVSQTTKNINWLFQDNANKQGWVVTKYCYFIIVLSYFSEYFYAVLLLLLSLLFQVTILHCNELLLPESTVQKYFCIKANSQVDNQRFFVPNRSRIRDDHFEQQLLLRINVNL